MFTRKRIGRGFVSLLVIGSLMFGATAAIAAETDQATDSRRSDVAAHRPIGNLGQWIISNTMEILDVNRGQIVSTLAQGGTLADLAEEQGSSGEALANALVAKAQARADEAVASGQATEEQAAKFMERVTQAINKAVFNPHHPGDKVRRHFQGLRGLLWKTTVEFLDVNRGDIMSTFAQGGTLADLAEEQGSSGDALVDELVGAVDAKLSDAVADGKITEEQKAEMLDKASEVIRTFVFSPHQPGRGNQPA